MTDEQFEILRKEISEIKEAIHHISQTIGQLPNQSLAAAITANVVTMNMQFAPGEKIAAHTQKTMLDVLAALERLP